MEHRDGKPGKTSAEKRGMNQWHAVKSLLICADQLCVKYPHAGNEWTFLSTENFHLLEAVKGLFSVKVGVKCAFGNNSVLIKWLAE